MEALFKSCKTELIEPKKASNQMNQMNRTTPENVVGHNREKLQKAELEKLKISTYKLVNTAKPNNLNR